MMITRRCRCAPVLYSTLVTTLVVSTLWSGGAAAQTITEIIDSTGDGAGNRAAMAGNGTFDLYEMTSSGDPVGVADSANGNSDKVVTVSVLGEAAALGGVDTLRLDTPLLSNGDFETGDLTGWIWTPDPGSFPGMVADVAPGPFATGNAFRVNPGTATVGNELGGVLSQSVFLTASTTYTISGDIAIQDVNSPPGDPSGNADGGVITVSIGPTTLHVLDIGQIEVDQLILDSFDVDFTPVVSDFYDLELHFTRTFLNSGPSVLHWVDNLSIVAEAVAEPLLDIRPGSCPNSFNRNSHGVLPVALLGGANFDITTVDVSSVRLSRADGGGGEVAPNEGPPGPHSEFDDVASPFEPSTECECDALGGDGIVDLSMKFKTDDVVAALELNNLSAGDLVPLVVTGTLLDGTPFETATDCIRLVPPGTPPGVLTVESNMSASWVAVSPVDLALDGGGFAAFDRVFPQGSVVTLTAEASMNRRPLIAWQVNGVTMAATLPTCQIVISGDTMTVRAIYRTMTSNNLPMLRKREVNSGTSEPQ